MTGITTGASRTARLRRPRGYSLVDMVVTVMIIGIVAGVTAPRVAGSLHWARAQSAAKRIKADLVYARNHAIATSSMQAVQFSPVSHEYQMPGAADLDHAGQTYVVKLASAPYYATLASASLGGDAILQFDHYGQPDSGGTITVAVHGYQQTITIDSQTGVPTIP